MTSPQDLRKNRLLDYNRGVILQVGDKEIPISRRAASLSSLLTETLHSPDAEEDVKGWDEKKLTSEPLLEVVVPINLYSFTTMSIVGDYLRHFSGDDSKSNVNNEWEQKFIQNIIRNSSTTEQKSSSGEQAINQLVDVLSAANYFNIPSLIKITTEYLKTIIKSNDIETLTSKNGPLHPSTDMISTETEIFINAVSPNISVLNSQYPDNFSVVLFDDGHYFASNDHFKSALALTETATNFPNKIKSGISIIEVPSTSKSISCYRIPSIDNKKYYFGWVIASIMADETKAKSSQSDETKMPSIASYENIVPSPNRLDTFKLCTDREHRVTIPNLEFIKLVNEVKEVSSPRIIYLKRIKYLTPKIPKSLALYGSNLRNKLIIKTLLSFKSFPVDLIPMVMTEKDRDIIRYVPKEYHYVPEHIIQIDPFCPVWTTTSKMLSIGKYVVIVSETPNESGFNIFIGYIIEATSPYRMWGLKIPYKDQYSYGDVKIDKLIKIDDYSFVTQHVGDKRTAAIWDVRELDMKTGTRDKITIHGFRPNIPVLQPKYLIEREPDSEMNIDVNATLPGYVYAINTLRDLHGWGLPDDTQVNLTRISVSDGSIKKVKVDADRSNVRVWTTTDGKVIVSPLAWHEGRNIIKVFNFNLEEINPSVAELKVIDEYKNWVPSPARTDYKYTYNEDDFQSFSRKNSITIFDKTHGRNVKITFPEGRILIKAELFEDGFIVVTRNVTEFPSPTVMYRYSIIDNRLEDLGCAGVDFVICPDTKKLIVLSGYSGYPEIWR